MGVLLIEPLLVEQVEASQGGGAARTPCRGRAERPVPGLPDVASRQRGPDPQSQTSAIQDSRRTNGCRVADPSGARVRSLPAVSGCSRRAASVVFDSGVIDGQALMIIRPDPARPSDTYGLARRRNRLGVRLQF